MTKRTTRWIGCLLLAVSILGGCKHKDRNRSGVNPPACPATEAATTCPCDDEHVCHQGRCYTNLGACTEDGECQNDGFCADGACVPFREETREVRAACRAHAAPFAATDLVTPKLKCQWASAGVLGTPLVLDLGGDAAPEIVFVADTLELVAIRGDTCAEVFRVATEISRTSNLAAGDLDGDEQPELVGITLGGRVVVHAADGSFITQSDDASSLVNSSDRYGGPVLVDLPGSAGVEIVEGGLLLEYANKTLKTRFNVDVNVGGRGALTFVADVDGDGKAELVTGNGLFDAATGEDETPDAIARLEPGYPALADLDPDAPGPEVVLVSSSGSAVGTVTVYNPTSGAVVFGPYEVSSEGGGAPLVADLDGDGAPEIGVAGYETYTVLDFECVGSRRPASCADEGIRWRRTIRDVSSAVSGSAAFDLDGDGAAEVLSRDECWLRAFDGATGKVRFATTVTSATTLEGPVVADVDGDGHAEIVVTSDGSMTDCPAEDELGTAPGAPTEGVLVFEDPTDRWQPARPVWNQHAYHVTHVTDTGTIPSAVRAPWELVNGFREQVALAPDLTVRPPCGAACEALAELCNRGTGEATSGASVTFYDDDPRAGGEVLCSTTTDRALPPGTCVPVVCEPTRTPAKIWAEASETLGEECESGNNLARLCE